MAFNVTVYVHNNPEIYNTSWKVVDENVTYSAKYNDFDSKGASAKVSGGNIIFEADPEDGYVFTRWVYRVGSITSDVQYSDKNPFTYKDEKDIFIRAEGTESDLPSSWRITSNKLGSGISGNISKSVNISEYETYCYQFSCAASGTATFYSKSDLDTVGYLSTSSDFYYTDGEPRDYETKDDDTGSDSNFKFTYEVEAGTTYYLWVRCFDGEVTGDIDIFLQLPSSSSSGGGTTGNAIGVTAYIYITYNGYTHWVRVKPYIYKNNWDPYSPHIYK